RQDQNTGEHNQDGVGEAHASSPVAGMSPAIKLHLNPLVTIRFAKSHAFLICQSRLGASQLPGDNSGVGLDIKSRQTIRKKYGIGASFLLWVRLPGKLRMAAQLG